MNATAAEIEAGVEVARPVAIGMIERGAPMDLAIDLGALFAAFMWKNGDLAKRKVLAGMSPEAVADEMTADFKTFCKNANEKRF